MARKNIPVTIVRPGVQGLSDVIVFAANASADDIMVIPRRYPFADIQNYDALETAGYFRHGSKVVATELGGSATTNTEGVLGYQLPRTEKLFLLVRPATTLTADATITVRGSDQYHIDDLELVIANGTTVDKLYEIDLFDMGLFLEGVSGNPGVEIEIDSVQVEFALVVRSA